MDLFGFLHSMLRHVERLNFQQYALLVVVIVVIGISCMRGFGSRSNY